MENIAACRRLVEALHQQADNLADALEALKDVFVQESEHLRRQDQAQCLGNLEVKVAQEVEVIRRMEMVTSTGFSQARLVRGMAMFALGAVAAAAFGSRKRPLSVGAKLAHNEFRRTDSFGSVLVAVGPGGIPDNVSVIPLSKRSRELGRSESEVIADLKTKGYRLMTPEGFSMALNDLKGKVLRGISVLPMAASTLEAHHEGLS